MLSRGVKGSSSFEILRRGDPPLHSRSWGDPPPENPPPGVTPWTSLDPIDMAQTSVHLKACDIAASETHNKREKELDYVRKDLTHLNESFSFIPHSLQTELANIRKTVKEKTGRKLQKNAVPIKEGVIVIDGKTTMSDLQRYCEECRNKFGILPLQIHIHRDEGHVKAKEWKPNLHAHIVWSMYGKDGRNIRLSKQDCSDMQTMASEVLGMERGKSSDKKHLSSLQFKIQAQEKRIEELEELVNHLSITQERAKGAFEGAKQGVSDLFTGKARKKAEDAEKRAIRAEKQAQTIKKQAKEALERAQEIVRNSEERTRKAEIHAEEISREWKRHSRELEKIAEYKDMADVSHKELFLIKKNLPEVLQHSSAIGLSVENAITLASGKEIHLDSVTINDNVISMEDGSPIRIKWNGNIIAKLASSWYSFTEWCRKAIQSPWCAVNGVSNHRKKGLKL